MIVSLFLSSGDLIADRRYDFACDLLARGDTAAAIDLLEQAIEQAPDFVSAWFALAELRAAQGDRAGAIAAFEKARALDPADRFGAGLHLARLGAAETGEMPAAYVQTLFDQYAATFDRALLEGLNYRGPQLLFDVVTAVAPGRRFARAIDLGCGTGLAGRAFRPLAEFLVGVDLSPGMVEQARRAGCYDRLDVADMLDFLRSECDTADLVIAADAFVYLAGLTDILTAIARLLKTDGLAAFTVETHAGDGIILGEKLRYAHGESYVHAALAQAGLTPLSLEPASTRIEAGLPVPGLAVVARPVDRDPQSG